MPYPNLRKQYKVAGKVIPDTELKKCKVRQQERVDAIVLCKDNGVQACYEKVVIELKKIQSLQSPSAQKWLQTLPTGASEIVERKGEEFLLKILNCALPNAQKLLKDVKKVISSCEPGIDRKYFFFGVITDGKIGKAVEATWEHQIGLSKIPPKKCALRRSFKSFSSALYWARHTRNVNIMESKQVDKSVLFEVRCKLNYGLRCALNDEVEGEELEKLLETQKRKKQERSREKVNKDRNRVEKASVKRLLAEVSKIKTQRRKVGNFLCGSSRSKNLVKSKQKLTKNQSNFTLNKGKEKEKAARRVKEALQQVAEVKSELDQNDRVQSFKWFHLLKTEYTTLHELLKFVTWSPSDDAKLKKAAELSSSQNDCPDAEPIRAIHEEKKENFDQQKLILEGFDPIDVLCYATGPQCESEEHFRSLQNRRFLSEIADVAEEKPEPKNERQEEPISDCSLEVDVFADDGAYSFMEEESSPLKSVRKRERESSPIAPRKKVKGTLSDSEQRVISACLAVSKVMCTRSISSLLVLAQLKYSMSMKELNDELQFLEVMHECLTLEKGDHFQKLTITMNAE